MNPAGDWSEEVEAAYLETLRARFEADGYEFIVHPSQSQVPDFVGSYRPDAIARKAGKNIAIEVKRSRSTQSQDALQRIQKLFAGHPDWQLNAFIVAEESTDPITVPPSSRDKIKAQLEEARAIKDAGHYRAALLLGWALLESVSHSLPDELPSRPRKPGTVIQMLAMRGYLEEATEQKLRSLAVLRNRVVHGDLSVDVTSADADFVLTAAAEALAAAPA